MKHMGNRIGVSTGLGTLALGRGLLWRCGALGQDAGQASGQPARAVRLSTWKARCNSAQGDQVLADQALVNTPLFEGTQLTTVDDGKAEIQFEDGSVARISPDSSLTLNVLRGAGASATAELVVNGGLGYFELQGGSRGGQMRVRFGDSVATASGFTVMRINMDNPPGELAVFSGNAHLERGNRPVRRPARRRKRALNGTDPSHYDLVRIDRTGLLGCVELGPRPGVDTEAAADQTGAAKPTL